MCWLVSSGISDAHLLYTDFLPSQEISDKRAQEELGGSGAVPADATLNLRPAGTLKDFKIPFKPSGGDQTSTANTTPSTATSTSKPISMFFLSVPVMDLVLLKI